MKILGQLACLLACLVVVGVGCPWAKPTGTPEECLHWIAGWPDPMLDEAMLSARAPAMEARHHAFWAQSRHPTGILTSLPDQSSQAGSQSTDATGGMGPTHRESFKAIEHFRINQPSPPSAASLMSDSLTSPALASLHSASPSIITTTTGNQSKRKSPPRIEVELPFGSPIKNKTGRPRGSSAALPITQHSASPLPDLNIPFQSDTQPDHRQPYFDSAPGPSQERPQKRIMRPQRALDEPAHPVLGSIQGREILPAEPPETLPPQALITFDVSLFQLVGSADVAANDHQLQQRQIDSIRMVIEACPSKLLIIPEERFLELSKFFRSRLHQQVQTSNTPEGLNINHAKNTRRKTIHEINRQWRLTTKVKEFHGHVDFWYDRWFANTGTRFKINTNLPHYQFLLPQRLETLHPLYLLYVEMISSFVPRTSQRVTLASDLKSAQEAFEHLSKAANEQLASRGDEQSFNNAAIEGSVDGEADTLLNKAVNKLEAQKRSNAVYHIFSPLWTYLGFWIDTNRPGIFKPPGQPLDCELPVTSKAFINAVFFHSYTALYRRCFLDQRKATPVFMS